MSPHNLRTNVTPFVGRSRELLEIRSAFASTRLLTLTGIGGSGKTRLAVRLAESVLEEFLDGVWLVEIAPLVDPTLIAVTVAAVVGVPEVAGRDLSTQLVDAFRSRRMLLIFDGCQNLVAECARLADVLLASCPGLKVMATSRERLAASGEAVWPVPNLSAPDPDKLPAEPEALVTAVVGSDAGQLFASCAQRVNAGFAVTPANASNVAQICHHLGGIPLAIELTVSRLRSMSIEQVKTGVENLLPIAGGSPSVSHPEQPLRGVIDWTHDLLSPENQAFFRKLAVFADGWRLDAAAAVGFGDENNRQPISRTTPGNNSIDVVDVLNALTRLTEHALVAVDDSTGGVPRYRLAETIRDYAINRLAASGEADASRALHAGYYQILAKQRSIQMWVGQDFRDPEFVDEINNIRGALRWCLNQADWDNCLGLIASLSVFWFGGGHPGESAEWIDLALRYQDGVAPATRGRLLIGLGRLAFGRGEYVVAEDLLRAGVEASRAAGERSATARGLVALGFTWRDVGRLGEAGQVLAEALDLSRDIGDRGLICGTLLQEGLLARQQGEFPRARGVLTEALRLVRDIGALPGVECQITYNLGLVDEDQGDRPGARYWYVQSIPVAQAAGFRWLLPFIVEAFVTLAAREGQAEKAMVLAGAAAAARQLMGNPIPPVMKIRLDHGLSRARLYLGDAADAAWTVGQEMTLEQAIVYATSDAPPKELPVVTRSPI